MDAARIAALCCATIGCGIDLQRRRIPNWLTLGSAVAGLAWHVANSRGDGLLFAIAGGAVGLVMFVVPFALGGLGAGDVKLVAALGTWLGPSDALWLALYTGVAGGALALIVSLASGYLREAIGNVWLLLMHWRVAGMRPLPELTLKQARGPKLAYGLSIFAGTVVTICTR